MVKIYFRDVSRRLLLFTLLLLGVASSVIADDHYVCVFKETPWSDGRFLIKSGTVITNGTVGFRIFKSTLEQSTDLNVTFSKIVNTYWTSGKVAETLGLDDGNLQPFPNEEFVLPDKEAKITGKTDIYITSKSEGSTKRYYLLLNNDSRVVAFGKFPNGQGKEIKMGTISAVGNDVYLPSLHFSTSDQKVDVATLKAALLADLNTAFGTNIVSEIKITKENIEQSGKLVKGEYSYQFKVTAPDDQAYLLSDNGKTGEAKNTVKAGTTETVTVALGIKVTNNEVVTIKVPAKEVLSYYTDETIANVNQLSTTIVAQIENELEKAGLNLTVSAVSILIDGVQQSGNLEANDYSYSFVLEPNTSDKEILFQRIPGGNIETVVEGAKTTVTVSNSIEIKPVLDLSVFSANYTPVSPQVKSEVDFKKALHAGLVKQNKAFEDVISFEITTLRDNPVFPLGVGTYSYSFSVRAKEEVKIAVSGSSDPTYKIITAGNSRPFSAYNKIIVKKSVVSDKGKIVFPSSFTAVSFGTEPAASLRAAISLTDMPSEAEGYVLSLVDAGGKEYDLSQTPTLAAGQYTVKLTLPESETYDFSKVIVDGGTKSVNVFTATAKLTISKQKIGEVVLPAWLQTTPLGQLDALTVNAAKNRILNQISTNKGISSVKIYSDDNFNTEVTSGRLIPGNVYSYIVTLDANYTDGRKTTTPVGSVIVSFDKTTNSYKIKNAISVKKASVVIALPDRLSNPIKIGSEFATTQDLKAYLIATINTINETAFAGTGLTATVSDIDQLPTVNNTTIGYTVTVSVPGDPAYLSKFDYSFVTSGPVTSANLQVTDNVCVFSNSLRFVDVLPTTATTMRVPKYSFTYEYGWKAKDVTTQIAEDLLLKNAGILIMEKSGSKYIPNYTVALINSQGGPVSNTAAVTEGEVYGYSVTINKSETLQDVDLDLPNVTVTEKDDKITITHVNSVTLTPRSDANFISRDANVTMSGVDFAYNYTAGITKAEIIERIKSAILFANPGLEGYIGEVTLPDVMQDSDLTDNNGDFKSSYKVVLTDAVADFKAVTVNGSTSGITTEGTSYIYTGQFGLIARPILTIKLNTYTFNENDGSLTEEVIEEWIKADLLKNNQNLMGVSLYAVNYNPELKGYTVFFQNSANVRSINFDPATVRPVVMQNGNIRGRYPNSITFGPEGDIPGVPYHMNVALPSYIDPALTFGKTAAEYGEDILAAIQTLIKPHDNALFPQIPTLKNWGAKVSLILNESGETAEAIADNTYPQATKVYGYKIEFANKADFEKFYTFVYTASGGKLEVDNSEFVYKLSVAIQQASHTVTLPQVNVTYRDINTKLALQDSIKNAILEDAGNAAFFADVAKLMRPARSFTVTLDAPAEGPVPAKSGYGYTVEFAKLINENIAVSTTGTSNLNVNKAALELAFPVTSYKYGRSKVSIESDLLNKFIDNNNDLFSQYACLADNLSDLFTMNLDNVNATPPAVGEYSYTITVKEEKRTAWDNFTFTYNGAAVFSGYAHQHGNGVSIGQRKLTVALPTYLAATTEEGTAAKAAFTFGKATKGEIVQQIYDDIVALNGSKIKSDYTLAVDLVIDSKQMDNENPVIGNYSYTAKFTSDDYTFAYSIEGAEVTLDQDTEVATAVEAVKVAAPGIVVTFNEEMLEGVWNIVAGKPEYTLNNLTLAAKDFGFDFVTIKEDPENPGVAMTKARWNQLFNTNKLHWALYQNNNLKFHGNTLNSVLVDSIKNNVTRGKYTLRIIDGSTFKAAIGNFEIQLDADLVDLIVTPATVEVKAAKDVYTKVYGTEVTKDTDLSAKLTFATEPKLTAAKLSAEKNIINLFETISPIDTDVYEAAAPVGDYQIRAIGSMVKDMFAPVVGVEFAASKTEAKVTVTPAPLTADDLTIKVSVTREYGEDATDTDVKAEVTGTLSEAFLAEITKLLNAENVNRTSWFDLTGVNKKTDVGTYELRFTQAASQIATLLPNFNISEASLVNAGLTVTKAPLTVRAKSYNRPYGAGNPDLEIEYVGLKNNEYENLADVFSVMPKVATDARSDSRGSYDIYFTTEGEARNYAITHENGILSIDKIRRTIIWPEDQRNLVIPVGETVELSAYLKSEADGKPSISDIRYELLDNDRERVILSEVSRGVYAITGKVRTEGDNYVTIKVYADGDDTYEDAIPVTGTIKVIAPEGDAAKVNVIVSNVTSIYDGNPRAVSVKVTDVETSEAVKDFSIYYEGDQLGSVPTTYPSTQDAPTEAGVYSVTVKATVGSVTYSYTAKNKMVIAPKPVVVTARSFNIKYGDALPSYANAYDYNKNDFLNGEDFLVNQAPVVRIEGYNKKAGTYKLTPYSAQDFGRNYVITYVSGLLTIDKASVTIVADNKESVYGDDLEELTYTATGFVNGETLKHLGFAPRISSTVTRTSDVGVYPITFSDKYTSDNYEVSYRDGQYNLAAASQKISWNPENVIDVEGGDVILNATASSKLPVIFNSTNDAVAYVNQIGDTWILTPVASGTVTVTAMQHGNKNYNAAEPVAVTFLVEDEYMSVGNEAITVNDNIDVYPRLFTHSVTVTAPSAIKQVELRLMNGALQKVIRKPGSVIDLSSFGSGIYLLNVKLEDGTRHSVKIIKK